MQEHARSRKGWTDERHQLLRQLYPRTDQTIMVMVDRLNELPGFALNYDRVIYEAGILGLRRPTKGIPHRHGNDEPRKPRARTPVPIEKAIAALPIRLIPDAMEWQPVVAERDDIIAWVQGQNVQLPVTLTQTNKLRKAVGLPPFVTPRMVQPTRPTW